MWYTISLISEYNIYYTTKKSKLKDNLLKIEGNGKWNGRIRFKRTINAILE